MSGRIARGLAFAVVAAGANREIVAYCRGPYSLLSFDAVEMLRAKGRKARRLAEGYPEWQSAGVPVDRSAPESAR